MTDKRNFILFNITINRTIQIRSGETYKTETNNNLTISPDVFAVRTDFTNSQKLIRKTKKDSNDILSFNQASQVHEFVIQYILAHYQTVKGINFVVKDPERILIEIQIQLSWWEKFINKGIWNQRCRQLSTLISSKMPVGLCNIKPI